MRIDRFFLLAALMLATAHGVAAQQGPPAPRASADSTPESDVYPVGDAVDVYRAVLDLLYVDGEKRPSVIVLWEVADYLPGGPCTRRCTESWSHQSPIDTTTIIAFTQLSARRPRIIDFGYEIPIDLVSENGHERMKELGYGYLAHLPPRQVGPDEAFWEGFKRKYPGAWGRVVFTKVGFNPGHTEALMRVLQACGTGCSSNETVLLKRVGKEWRVVERIADPSVSMDARGTLRYRGPKVPRFAGFGYKSELVEAASLRTRPSAKPVDLAKIGVYSGVFTSSAWENTFSPCDVQGIGSGWAVRFAKPRHGAFLQYQYPRPGQSSVSHFVQVRGRVSARGRFGLGFQAREIVVDSVLAIADSPQPCQSYEDLPHPWPAVPAWTVGTVSAAVDEEVTLAASLDTGAIIRVWDLPGRAVVRQFPGLDTGRLEGWSGMPMAFSRDAKLLAAGGPDGVVRVWNPRDGRRVWTLGTDTVPRLLGLPGKRSAFISDLVFNEHGTLLASTGGNKTVIWSMASGDQLAGDDADWSGKLLFLRDSSFVVGGDDGVVRHYARPASPPIRTIRTFAQHHNAMQVSPDGRWLVVRSQGGDTARVWSLADGVLESIIASPSSSPLDAIAFSPDGNTIAMAGGRTGLYLWETKTGRPLRSFQKYPGWIRNAWFTSDGGSIVTYSGGLTPYRIVHLNPKNRSGVEAKRSEPVQALWGAPLPRAGELPYPRSISGFVKDPTGNAVVKADISLYDGDRPGSAPIARVSTNAAGYYLVQNVGPTHVIVHAQKRGFARETIYVHVPTRWADKDLKMRKTGR